MSRQIGRRAPTGRAPSGVLDPQALLAGLLPQLPGLDPGLRDVPFRLGLGVRLVQTLVGLHRRLHLQGVLDALSFIFPVGLLQQILGVCSASLISFTQIVL